MVAGSRGHYNASVRSYDEARKVFPTSIIASMFNFEDREYFEVETVEVRAPPTSRSSSRWRAAAACTTNSSAPTAGDPVPARRWGRHRRGAGVDHRRLATSGAACSTRWRASGSPRSAPRIGLLFTFIAIPVGAVDRAARREGAAGQPLRTPPNCTTCFDEVCVSAGIMGNKPTLHIVDDPAPNAFATGLKLEDSHIAVTTGLIERLPRYELRAVLAHEVAHIVNDDIRAVTVAVATAGLVALLADVLVRMMWFGGGRGGGAATTRGAAGHRSSSWCSASSRSSSHRSPRS
jgi:hypothetical protein